MSVDDRNFDAAQRIADGASGIHNREYLHGTVSSVGSVTQIGTHNYYVENAGAVHIGDRIYTGPSATASRPIAKDRVCEVYAPDRDGSDLARRLRCGSGLLIADRMVLTSAHAVGDVGATAQVRLPEVHGAAYHQCEVVWSRGGEDVDAALLRVTALDWVPPAGLEPLRWGRLVSAQARVFAQAAVPGQAPGFPDVNVISADRDRDWAYPAGPISTRERPKSRRLDLVVDSPPGPLPEGSPWQGISGAGLFVNGLLIGVIVQNPIEYAGQRLTAVQVERFATDPAFATLVWGEHRRGWPLLEPAELAGLQYQPTGTDSPAWLLRAEAEVVPFRGREEVLSRLLGWCEEPGQRSVRLLTGPGGQGKTRLARELAWHASHAGWAVLTLADDVLDAAYEQLRAVNVPLLVVVDYPELRRDQLSRLVGKLSRGSPVRLLLVARTNGAWLPELEARSREFAALLAASRSPARPPVALEEPLGPLAGANEGRESVFAEAAAAFADRLGASGQSAAVVDWRSVATRVPTPDLSDSRYGNVLAVQMAALAGLLEAAHGRAVAPQDRPEQVLLGHEEGYWNARADCLPGLDLTDQARRRVVTVATLCTVLAYPDGHAPAGPRWAWELGWWPRRIKPWGAREEPSATLDHVSELADQPAAARLAAAQWLGELYGRPGWHWSTLQPDRLHEYLVGTVFEEHPAALDRVAPHLTARQACQVLTVLARAAVDHPGLNEVIGRLVARHSERLAPAAFAVAMHVETPAPLHAALAALDAKERSRLLRGQQLSDAATPPILRWLKWPQKRPTTTRESSRARRRQGLTSWRSRTTRLEPATETTAAGSGSTALVAVPVLAPPDLPQAPPSFAARLYSTVRVTPGLGRAAETLQQNPVVAGGVTLLVAAAVATAVVAASTPWATPNPATAQPAPSATAVASSTTAPASSGTLDQPSLTPSGGVPSGGFPSATPTGPAPVTTNPADPGNPTVAAPVWGYVYVNLARGDEAPIGTPTKVHPSTQWTTGAGFPSRIGHEATVTHTGTGQYTVRMPDVAADVGVAHSTAYRTNYQGRVCGIGRYRTDGPDELVDVHCFDRTGALADWYFTLFFAAPPAGSGTYATLRYQGSGGGKVTNSGTYNPAGRGNHVQRDGPGQYRVLLEGVTGGNGYVQLTTYGATAARCAAGDPVGSAEGVQIPVSCFAIGGSAPADSGFVLSYLRGIGLPRDPGIPAAYAMTTGDPANPAVDTARSYASNGDVPTVARQGTGWYRLTWPRIGKYGDSVQVVGRGAAYCHLGAINSYSVPPQLTVDVYCHNPAGTLADALFGVAYLRAP